jgi:acyl-CoA-binding protein
MEELKMHFERVASAVRSGNTIFNPDNMQKLKLYAFYKQATEGDIAEECPSIVDMVGRAKWNAWNAIKGMSADNAMQKYIDLVECAV